VAKVYWGRFGRNMSKIDSSQAEFRTNVLELLQDMANAIIDLQEQVESLKSAKAGKDSGSSADVATDRRLLIDDSAAQDYTGLSRDQLKRARLSGRLNYYQPGGAGNGPVFYKHADLESFIEGNRV